MVDIYADDFVWTLYQFHFEINCSDEIVIENMIEYQFAEYISLEFVICSNIGCLNVVIIHANTIQINNLIQNQIL